MVAEPVVEPVVPVVPVEPSPSPEPETSPGPAIEQAGQALLEVKAAEVSALSEAILRLGRLEETVQATLAKAQELLAEAEAAKLEAVAIAEALREEKDETEGTGEDGKPKRSRPNWL